MRLKILLTFLFVFTGIGFCFAQPGGYMQSRILILLDKSSSMINLWDGGREKSKVGNEIVLRIMDSVYAVNPNVEFSLRVFGANYTVADNNCHDTRNELPFRKDNRLQMEYRLDDIKPLGVTSIAFALQEAAENDLVDVTNNAYSIILITDGGESCGGDICEVMRKLAQSKVFFRPYIVNLEPAPELKTAYECMGDYLEVTKQGDIPSAVSKIVAAFRPVINITTKEYTKVKEVAATAPTVLNVTIPKVKLTDTIKVKDTVVRTVVTGATISRIPFSKAVSIRVDGLRPATVVSTNIPLFLPLLVDEEPEPEKIPVINIPRAPVTAARTIRVDAPATVKAGSVRPPVFVFQPIIIEEPFVKPASEAIAKLAPAPAVKVTIAAAATTRPRAVVTGPYVPLIVEEIPPRPAPVTIARLQPSGPRRYPILFVYDSDQDGSILRTRKVPPMPPLKFDPPPPPPKPVATSKPKPMTTPKIQLGKAAEFKIETEDAEETTVEVYFTNGNGKFFATTPQVQLLNTATGAMVKRFYRTVDADGNPDPQKNIPPGSYHLAFSETRSLVVYNAEVVEHKKNKIYVTVNKASLSFEYAANVSRPVIEFSALVTERNKPSGGRIVNQKCTERLEFEPGNYHVIINTFPQDVRNIDLDFDEKVIGLLQPGFAKFTAEPEMTSVTLYQRLGEKFQSFHTLNLKNPAAQHLQIQPGEYQAHYHKGPGGTYASEKVVNFIIKATEETEVVLN
jgi:hypothetical protein